MKIFFDTEFIERGREYPLVLISLGAVNEEGEEFYEISNEFDPETASEWVKQNVLSKLEIPQEKKRLPIGAIARKFLKFAGPEPEFWAYYADYDWVILCQLFGTMAQLPNGWPMYCRDIKQLCDDKGNPKLPKEEDEENEHNALEDAKWNKKVWTLLVNDSPLLKRQEEKEEEKPEEEEDEAEGPSESGIAEEENPEETEEESVEEEEKKKASAELTSLACTLTTQNYVKAAMRIVKLIENV